MLLVHLEIIATAWLCSLYSHLCISVSLYTPYSWTGCRQLMWAIQGAPADDNWGNSEIHIEVIIGDTYGNHNGANLQAMIEQVWWCTINTCWSKTGGVHAGSSSGVAAGRSAKRWVSTLQFVNLWAWKCGKTTLSLSSHGDLPGGDLSCRKAHKKLKLYSGVNSKSWESIEAHES
jgi:hypothetical protein